MKIATVICAGLLLIPVSWGTSTPSTPKKFHSSSSHSSHSKSTYNEKNLPQSTTASVPSAKPRTGSNKELARIEHQSAGHPLARSKHKTTSGSGHLHSIDSHPSGRGGNTNFAYHPPRGSQGKRSAAAGRRR